MPSACLVTPSGMSKLVDTVAHRAGVRLSMRSLRRGFGCRHAGKVPAQVLQRLMRHAKIDTTMNFYANVDDAVEEAILGPKCNKGRNSRANQGAVATEVSGQISILDKDFRNDS
jgi:integrase